MLIKKQVKVVDEVKANTEWPILFFQLQSILGPTAMQRSMPSSLRNLQCESCVILLAPFYCLDLKLGTSPLFQGGTDGMGYVWAAEPDYPGSDFQGGACSFFYANSEPNWQDREKKQCRAIPLRSGSIGLAEVNQRPARPGHHIWFGSLR